MSFLVDVSAGHMIIACRKDWVGWQTKKSGLVSRCLWPSSHPPPASAEQEKVAQPENVTTYCGPSSDLFFHSKPNQLEDSRTGRPSLLLLSQESLGAPASEQVQDRRVLMIPAVVHLLAGLFMSTCLRCLPACMHLRHSQSANKLQNEWP